MDTSEQYIKMCEKAEEIQDLRRDRYDWEDDDDVFEGWIQTIPPSHEPWIWKAEDVKDLEGRTEDRTIIWLPRQDQLQEMVEGHPYEKMERCWKFAMGDDGWMFDSMEQLWLAFVMKEKFGKTWNGEDWSG